MGLAIPRHSASPGQDASRANPLVFSAFRGRKPMAFRPEPARAVTQIVSRARRQGARAPGTLGAIAAKMALQILNASQSGRTGGHVENVVEHLFARLQSKLKLGA